MSVFQETATHMGQPTLNLFASRLCNQLPRYIAWKPDRGSIATDAFLHPWDREYKALCVAETLNEYINRSKPWRESNHEKQLLLSSIKPHNAVLSCTISGWLKKTPKQAGINTDLFNAHSTRSASSLKASVVGAPSVEILKRTSWSHHSTWQRFYNKDIIQKGPVVQDMVYKESGKN